MVLRNEEIAARIRELRGTKPQTLVAEEMGVAERTYQNWELGETNVTHWHGVEESYGDRRPVADRGAAEARPSRSHSDHRRSADSGDATA